MIRHVYIIDDDAAMRDSLSFLLSTQNLSVQTFDTAQAFLDKGDTLPTGCIVTDLRMPQMSGLELVEVMAKRDRRLPIIVMTGHGDVPLAVEAMKAGAQDFIEKPFSDELILSTLAAAFASLDRIVAEESRLNEIRLKLASLTAREREVMVGLVAGRANKVIADDLGISARTVEIYRANVMSKTGARSLSELVRMALEAGS